MVGVGYKNALWLSATGYVSVFWMESIILNQGPLA